MSLEAFFQTRTGQRIVAALENIATNLKESGCVTERMVMPDPAVVVAGWQPESDDYFKLRNNEAPWSFNARPQYAETFFFSRPDESGCHHFTGTVAGNSRDEIQWMAIYGDCGNEAFFSGQKMTLKAFANWIGKSHPHYLFSKNGIRREFNWAQARCDWEEFCETARAGVEGNYEKALFNTLEKKVEENLKGCEYETQQDFAEAIFEAVYADGNDTFGINDNMCDGAWGMAYSPQSYGIWRQARYFGLWLEERERLRA